MDEKLTHDLYHNQVMNAGPHYEYLWADSSKASYKTPTKASAYVINSMPTRQPVATAYRYHISFPPISGLGPGVRDAAAFVGGGAAQRRGCLPKLHG